MKIESSKIKSLFGLSICVVAPSLAFGVTLAEIRLPTFAKRKIEKLSTEEIRQTKERIARFSATKFEKSVLQPPPLQWALLDSKQNGVEGTSTELVYQNYPGSFQKEIVVAVLDGGVDWKNPDLEGKIWTNANEIPGNGIDDDKNGYVDDYRGWNFLGGRPWRDGFYYNIEATTLEVTREYVRLKKLSDEGTLPDQLKPYWSKVRKEYDNAVFYLDYDRDNTLSMLNAFQTLREYGIQPLDDETINKFRPTTESLQMARWLALAAFDLGNKSENDLRNTLVRLDIAKRYHYNSKLDLYAQMVDPNPTELNKKGYGNPDIIGPDPIHGTKIAGIIAATRNNSIGIDGQAQNVKIMSLRVLPDGDERDKDVGNAIRYAVDNGAHVIYMGFQKRYSPNKDFVDEAVTYAEAKNVVLVHAAGNSRKNMDESADFYPNAKTQNGGLISTWLEVGASGQTKDENLPYRRSNWGKKTVDIFAPGVQIVSLDSSFEPAPGNGTDYAAAQVTGVAALVMSMFPNTSAKDIRKALVNSATRYPGLKVKTPGGDPDSLVLFETLSASGGVVNAFRAVKLLK